MSATVLKLVFYDIDRIRLSPTQVVQEWADYRNHLLETGWNVPALPESPQASDFSSASLISNVVTKQTFERDPEVASP